MGTNFDPAAIDDRDGDDELLAFGPQRTVDWSRWAAAVLTRRAVRWALGSAVALALALIVAAPWRDAGRPRAVVPVPSSRPAAVIPTSADEYVLSVPAVDLSGVLSGPQCPLTAGCSIAWLADGRVGAEMSAFFDLGTAAGGDVVDKFGTVVFRSVVVRNQANVLIHLVAAWAPREAAAASPAGRTVSGAPGGGTVTVRVTTGRNGWIFTATVIGQPADKLPIEQARRWVRTSPLPS